MGTKFGSVIVSLGFEVDLDELAVALECEDEKREEIIARAKSDFMDTLIFEGGKMFDYLEVEEVANV